MKFDKQNLAHSIAHCHIINRELKKSDIVKTVKMCILLFFSQCVIEKPYVSWSQRCTNPVIMYGNINICAYNEQMRRWKVVASSTINQSELFSLLD